MIKPVAGFLSQLIFGFGQTAVNPQQRGLALGITETLAYGAIALSSWLAGQLYEQTPLHDLPLIVSMIAIPVAIPRRSGNHFTSVETGEM